jgi:hypothetical protein
MASSDDNHPRTAIPEADRLEQEQPAGPEEGSDQEWPASPTQDINEADRLEQARPVVTDPEEEYPSAAG